MTDLDLDNLLNFEDIDFADILAALRCSASRPVRAPEFRTQTFRRSAEASTTCPGFAAVRRRPRGTADNPARCAVLEAKINEAVGIGLEDGDLFRRCGDSATASSGSPLRRPASSTSLVGSILKLDLHWADIQRQAGYCHRASISGPTCLRTWVWTASSTSQDLRGCCATR
jgi:hypothetical protein